MEPYKSPVDNVLDTGLLSPIQIRKGWNSISRLIEKHCVEACATGKSFRIGIDGYLNVDWETVSQVIREMNLPGQIILRMVNIESCLKPKPERNKIISTCIPDGEPVFGKKYHGRLSDFFARKKLEKIAEEINGLAENTLFICLGSGALLNPLTKLYDLTFYLDVTREEVLKRNKAWTKQKSKTQSVSPRQIYYIDFPIHDKHRKASFSFVNFYADSSTADMPRVLPAESVREITGKLMSLPLRIKPLYEPGVWGGQWLKRNRKLPKKMVNCAYGFEIIAPEQSLIVTIGKNSIELPFNLLMENHGRKLLGKRAYKRYGDEFPVRVAYDDTWEGGNLSIQAHPTTKYMQQTFGEKIHQAEMYYIFDAKPGSIVHLGLNEGVEIEALHKAAKISEKNRKPFDHTEYVNVVKAHKGDIFLIPPGTVHGAGANELVLEISSTPYRYTFKIYDYLRPDLDGSFRPIHIEHAFNNIKSFRKTGWVASNLIPKPILINQKAQKQKDWKEYIIADRREFYHVVHRIEFQNHYEDNTKGKFHLLNLVEGDIVLVQAKNGSRGTHELALSETLLLPASVGPYEVINKTKKACKIVKTFLRA